MLDKLPAILEAHAKWLATVGVEGERANLDGANLYGANLYDATLRGADLPRLTQSQLSIVPESGSFEGWKQCRDGVIVHLRIPAEAQRSNATGRKCRASYVDVLAIYGADAGISLHDAAMIYRADERVSCDTWETDRWIECGGGIHFYLTRLEAEHHD